jgi:single-stranded DNA-binding protein
VFAPAKVKLIENAVQKGTRLRLVGQIRPGSWEDERGNTRYSVEFVVTGFRRGRDSRARQTRRWTPSLRRGAPAGEEPAKAKRKRAA